MPIPDFQTLMLPVLRGLNGHSAPIPLRSLTEGIAGEFALTEDECAQRLPSGGATLLSNRMAWAKLYLQKAGLVETPKRGLVAITEGGRALLRTSPARIDVAFLRRNPTFLEWQARTDEAGASSGPDRSSQMLPAVPVSAATPHERIDEAAKELQTALQSELLDRVRQMAPADFEGLIIRLLLAMGYGQGLEELARAIGGTGDGGMDGVIHQDPLGLDRVYIQAKRYREGNNVSSPDIRNFVGALNIHRANKGVFVTASQFTADAKQAASGSTVQVVLIDGHRLTELMVRYDVGVVTRYQVELKDVDEGFFTE